MTDQRLSTADPATAITVIALAAFAGLLMVIALAIPFLPAARGAWHRMRPLRWTARLIVRERAASFRRGAGKAIVRWLLPRAGIAAGAIAIAGTGPASFAGATIHPIFWLYIVAVVAAGVSVAVWASRRADDEEDDEDHGLSILPSRLRVRNPNPWWRRPACLRSASVRAEGRP